MTRPQLTKPSGCCEPPIDPPMQRCAVYRSKRWLAAAAAVLLPALCLGLLVRPSRPATAAGLPDGILASTFQSDLRNVVYRWAPEDRRPEAERRKALFDFVYQTYDSSAWIPQSLFDDNLIRQAVVGSVETIVRDRVGLAPWRDNRFVPAFGMAPNRSPGEPLRWTVNCLVCHTAEIDGVAYFGAGTKTFDDVFLGNALKALTASRLLPLAAHDRVYASEAHRILNSHHHEKIDSLTRGRSTAFAASHVELYMRPHGGRMPHAEDV